MTPTVSILVPVRDGAPLLRAALASLAAQSFRDVEILIADNCSTDATPAIIAAFLAEHPEARLLPPAPPLTALENFSRLIAAARGRYILFAAHDDLRNPDYVAALVTALEADPAAPLAFGRVLRFGPGIAAPEPLAFAPFRPRGPQVSRLAAASFRPCFHFYGLWRAEFLKKLVWRESVYWPDMQIMLAAAAAGPCAEAPGAEFQYYHNPRPDAVRLRYQNNRSALPRLYRWQVVTSSYACVRHAAGRGPALLAALLLIGREGVWMAVRARRALLDYLQRR